MAKKAITDLTATTTIVSSDIVEVVDGGNSRQATVSNLSKGVVVTNLDVTGLTASDLLRVNAGGTAIESAGVTLSGSDATVITGTAGTNGDLAQWNADGDLVDGPTPPSGTIVGTTDNQTLTNKDISNANNTYRSASASVSGAVELATAAETTTGTDSGRSVTPDGLAGSDFGKREIQVLVFDDATDVATGDGAGDVFIRISPLLNGMNLVDVGAQHQTAATGTGSQTTDIQIHNVTQAADMLSTKLTIDEDETDSKDAAAAAVIDGANDDVATGDSLRIDVDAIPSGAPKGLTVTLTFQKS